MLQKQFDKHLNSKTNPKKLSCCNAVETYNIFFFCIFNYVINISTSNVNLIAVVNFGLVILFNDANFYLFYLFLNPADVFAS